MTHSFEMKGDVLKIKSGEGYTQANKTLCKVKNTGNGYIFKFPTWNSIDQDNYVCIDYAEAEYMRLALNELEKNN